MASEYDVAIVGESKYQAEIARCIEGEEVGLYHEHDNRYDPNAIMVVSTRGEKIGYISRNSWLRRVLIDEGRKLSSAYIRRITGGEDGRGSLGVVLTVTLLTRKEAAAAEAELAARAKMEAEPDADLSWEQASHLTVSSAALKAGPRVAVQWEGDMSPLPTGTEARSPVEALNRGEFPGYSEGVGQSQAGPESESPIGVGPVYDWAGIAAVLLTILSALLLVAYAVG